MEENTIYLILRKFLFWFFFALFIIFCPVTVFYSMGYKFDRSTNKFLKTGAISIKTSPKDASVYLNGEKLNDRTPCLLRGLLPRKYSLKIEIDKFYPYEVEVDVRPFTVYEIDTFLISKIRHIEKLKNDVNIYNFFPIKQMLGEKILAFADTGIYYVDNDFRTIDKISSGSLPEEEARALEGVREYSNMLIFWNRNNVWLLDAPRLLYGKDRGEFEPAALYKAKEFIKNVFFSLKGEYLIIQDGLTVVALNIKNPQLRVSLLELVSVNANIFYDTPRDILYFKDKVKGIQDKRLFSLFRIKIKPLFFEGKEDEENP